jgi:hypothetical protein
LETQGKIKNDLSRPQWLLARRVLVAKDAWIEASATHLLATMILFVAAHLMLQRAHTGLAAQSTLDTSMDEADEFLQRLGLRDA